MSTRKPFTLIAAAIFAAMTLLHIYRLVTDFQIILGNHLIPLSVSYFAIIVSGVLAVMLYRESQR